MGALTLGRWGTVTPSWRSGRAGSEHGSVSAVSQWGGRFRKGGAVRKPLGSLSGPLHQDAAQSFRTERGGHPRELAWLPGSPTGLRVCTQCSVWALSAPLLGWRVPSLPRQAFHSGPHWRQCVQTLGLNVSLTVPLILQNHRCHLEFGKSHGHASSENGQYTQPTTSHK